MKPEGKYEGNPQGRKNLRVPFALRDKAADRTEIRRKRKKWKEFPVDSMGFLCYNTVVAEMKYFCNK